MFKIFKKKHAEPKKTGVKHAEIERVKVDRFEVKRVEPTRVNPFEIKVRNTETGELFVIDTRDFEAFDKVMGNKNMQLIFG